jgi:hypothetical protein
MREEWKGERRKEKRRVESKRRRTESIREESERRKTLWKQEEKRKEKLETSNEEAQHTQANNFLSVSLYFEFSSMSRISFSSNF